MTLLTVGNSEGERRCDAKCYNATLEHCDCVCGGLNHGKGEEQATTNVAQFGELMIENYLKDHPDERVSLSKVFGVLRDQQKLEETIRTSKEGGGGGENGTTGIFRHNDYVRMKNAGLA